MTTWDYLDVLISPTQQEEVTKPGRLLQPAEKITVDGWSVASAGAEVRFTTDPIGSILAGFGRDGWELVGVVPGGWTTNYWGGAYRTEGASFRAFFKRPTQT